MLKSRFPILRYSRPFHCSTQANLFKAFCTLHNFIAFNEIPLKQQIPQLSEVKLRSQATDSLVKAQLPLVSPREQKRKGDEMRDRIAEAMWVDYNQVIRSRRFR